MRTKSTIINFITDAFPQILILILGLFKSKIFIQVLGSDKLGLYQLYGQIVAYLVLIEGGIGSALLFRLYKPLKEHNNEAINSIMSASRIIFRIVGSLIFIVGFVISFFISAFIKETNFTFSFLQITFLIYLFSQAIFYFTIPYRTLFEADQKRYVPNLIFQITTIVKSALEIIIVLSGLDLIAILISLSFCSLLANATIIFVFKKTYKNVNFKSKKDFSMVKDIKDLFINTLGNLISNNIDILIISKLLGLNFVVIYSTYNYFVEGIKQFVDKITGATLSSVGDLLLDTAEKAKKIFNEFNEFVFFVASVICVPMFIFINKFITIWYKGNIEVSFWLALLFTTVLFYQITRIPLKVYTLSSGKFKVVKRFVILEIIINLLLSLILVRYIGISGVLLATVISLYIADWLTKPLVIYKQIFMANPLQYYTKYLINTVFIVFIATMFYLIVPKDYSSLLVLFIFGAVITVANLLVTLLYFYLTKQITFISRFNFFKKDGQKYEN